ncbi:MAG: hypothetical protein HY318_16285, partial [Armatimonadetes bacterium]|nr:hypothetical protein [Armatimonadota bacterium]
MLLNLLACAAFPIAVNSAHAASVDEDFETGNLARFPWQTGGDAAWQVSSDTSVPPGTYSARSGTIADNQTSELRVELPVQAGAVSFSLKTSVEVQGDYLKFLVDGVEQAVWTGDANWTQSGTFNVPAGLHTFSWVYAKDATDCTITPDSVWIDDIDFPSVSSFLPDLLIRGSGESSYLGQDVNSGDGTNQTKVCWVSSGETAIYVLRLRNKGTVADTFKVTAPPAETGWRIRYYDAVSGGTEVTSQVIDSGWVTGSIASGGFAEFRVEVSTLVAPTEGMASDCPVTARSNGSTALTDVVKATTHFTFASADEDFESGGFNLWPWKMGGDQGWQITTAENVTAGGTNSARSGSILMGQTSELRMTSGFTGGVISYACKVSSSPGYGRLEFCIDGVLKDTWSGEIDWTRSAEYSVATGVHAFLWRYIKDSATVGGQDAAWLDNIDLPPRSPYFPDALLRTKNDATFVGDGVFNLNGTNQSRTQWVSPSSKANYVVRVQNEGLSTDSIAINSVGSSVGWTVRLFDAATGGNEITSQAFGAGWSTPQLAQGGTFDLRLEITPDNSVPLTSGLDVGVAATSVGDRTWRDVVKATTVVGVPPVDEDFETGDLTKWPWQSTGWSNSSTDNITADGTFSASVQPAQGETNELKVTLILAAGNLKFYYKTSGQNGSDLLTLTIDGTPVGQWSGTANWRPSQDFAIAAGSHTFSWSFTRNSTSPSAGAWLDNIDFPPVAVNQADALIKRCSDPAASFQQDGVYQDVPAGAQVVQQVAGTSVTACYQVKIENDGSSNQSFAVRTSESNGSGWGIVYMIGAIDLTGLVRSTTGYITASLAPGASEVLTVSVTPDNSVPASSTQSTTVQVYLPGDDTQVRDSVKAITTTPPTVQFSPAGQISASESGTLTVSIDLSAPTIEEVVVPFSISGTATDTVDYTMLPVGSVTIPPGQTSASLLISIVDDSLDEPDESIIVTLGDPVHATKGVTAIHTATITDDDAPPGLSISDVSVTEGNSGTTGAVFVVSLSAASGKTITVDYTTANGSAQAGTDYIALTGSMTFAPGDISESVTVTVNGDTLREPDEDFSVNLSNQTNASLLDAAGKCTLINDDATPTLTVGNASVTEGNSGLQNLVFQFTLSSPSAQTVTVGYATANGTASATDDYVAASGTVTFNPMDTSRSVTVSVRGDTLYEPDETLLLNLSSPVNVALNNAQAVGSIVNDDPKPDQPDLLIRKGTEPDSSFAI